jgi:hypothetical protein
LFPAFADGGEMVAQEAEHVAVALIEVWSPPLPGQVKAADDTIRTGKPELDLVFDADASHDVDVPGMVKALPAANEVAPLQRVPRLPAQLVVERPDGLGASFADEARPAVVEMVARSIELLVGQAVLEVPGPVAGDEEPQTLDHR